MKQTCSLRFVPLLLGGIAFAASSCGVSRSVYIRGDLPPSEIYRVVRETFAAQGYQIKTWEEKPHIYEFATREATEDDKIVHHLVSLLVEREGQGWTIDFAIWRSVVDPSAPSDQDPPEPGRDKSVEKNMQQRLIVAFQKRGVPAQVGPFS